MLIYYREICSTPNIWNRGNKLHVSKEIKAISTLLAILLMLISAIFGALLAYMWTMAPFYFEPNTVDLVVTNLNFPADHGTYFDLTVMNPSHSISGTNITDIYIESQGLNKTSITNSVPELPIFLDRGTEQTFNCSLNWGGLAGQIITVHVLTDTNATASLSAQTPSVSVTVDAFFDPSESIQYFNGTVTVSAPTNLTLTQILFDYNPVENLSMTRPQVLQPNQIIPFTCYVNWEGHVKPIVQVTTREGFEGEVRKDVGSTIILTATKIDFDQTNTSQVNVTLFNSPDSATYVNITSITFKHGNVTDTFNDTLLTPTPPLTIDKNQTVTITCPWNWTDQSYRDMDVIVTAYTKQGFTSTPETARTPAKYAADMNDVHFDLNDPGSFSVNLTNRAYSLLAANLTLVEMNQNATAIIPGLIAPGTNATFTCTFNWSSLTGQNVNIKAHLMYGSTEIQVTYSLKLPYLEITNATFINVPPETPNINLTVRNTEFSKFNATIVQVLIRNETTSLLVIESSGYQVNAGSEIVLAYSWNWIPYTGNNITVVMTTIDGFQVSATFKVE